MTLNDTTIRRHLTYHNVYRLPHKHLRSSVNEVFLIGENNYILRMHKNNNSSKETISNILHQPYQAKELYSLGANVVPPASSYACIDDDWVSTLWHYGKPTENHNDITTALSSLHNVEYSYSNNSLKLSRMDIASIIEPRLHRFIHKTHHKEIANYVIKEMSKIRQENDVISHYGNHIVHLDGYQRNVVIFNDTPSLIDLDTLSLGAYQYDYIVSYVSQHYSQENTLSLPKEVEKWELFHEAFHLRTMDMFSWICEMSLSSPDHEKELLLRYASLEQGIDYKWNMKL